MKSDCYVCYHSCSYTSISNFTLNLLEDSGWYEVDYAATESLYNYELLWGKGELIELKKVASVHNSCLEKIQYHMIIC